MADALGIQAGSLTYGAFLSIPPALLIVGSVLGFVLAGDAEAQARVVDRIANAIPGLEPFVRDFLQSAIDGRASVGLLGLVTLTWTASGFAARARFALGDIFRTARPGLVTGRVRRDLARTTRRDRAHGQHRGDGDRRQQGPWRRLGRGVARRDRDPGPRRRASSCSCSRTAC